MSNTAQPLAVVSSQPLPDDHGAYAALSQATAISPQPPSTWEKFKTWVHDANYLPSTEYYKKYPTGPMDDVAAFATKLVPFAKNFNQLDQELNKHEASNQFNRLASGLENAAAWYSGTKLGRALTTGRTDRGAASMEALEASNMGMSQVRQLIEGIPQTEGPDLNAPWNKPFTQFRRGLEQKARDLDDFADRAPLNPNARALIKGIAFAMQQVPVGETAATTAAMLVNPDLPEGIINKVNDLNLEWRGWQEGVPGKHPDLAIFQDTKSGTSVGVPRDKLTPEMLQQHVEAARQRMSGLPKGKPDFSSVPGHLTVEKPTLGPGKDFYSPLEHVIQTKIPDRVSGDQLLSTLQNAGVSKRELEWSGVAELARRGQLSKDEILAQVRERTPHVETVEKKQFNPSDEDFQRAQKAVEAAQQKNEELKAKLRNDLGVNDTEANRMLNVASIEATRLNETPKAKKWFDEHKEDLEEYKRLINERSESYAQTSSNGENRPQYGSYTLPGGTNYREVLLTLPSAKERHPGVSLDRSNPIDQPDYNGPHFDEPNVVAHLRLDDRTDVNGNKTLFVEELQSDWARELREARDQGNIEGATPGEAGIRAARAEARVPDMPYDKSWQELALKKAIDIAVKEGYDQIAWTTGEQQADRYNLRNYFTQVRLSDTDEGLELEATPKEGGRPFFRQTTEENLPEEVGRDNAKKLLDQLEEARKQKGKEPYATTALKFDQPMAVGGEHHLRLYDEMVPQFLNRYTKKWGGKVEEATFKGTPSKTGLSPKGLRTVQALKITPEMRRAVKQGQPLFGGAKLDFSGIPGHTQHAPPAEDGGADLGAVYGGKPGKGKYAKFLQGEKKDFSSSPSHAAEEKKIEQFEPGDLGLMYGDGSVTSSSDLTTHYDLSTREPVDKVLKDGGVRFRVDRGHVTNKPMAVVQVANFSDKSIANAKSVIEKLPTDDILFEVYDLSGKEGTKALEERVPPVSFEGTPKEVIAQINRHVRANRGERYEVGEEGINLTTPEGTFPVKKGTSLYHTTTEEINKFKPDKITWFTPDKEQARGYRENTEGKTIEATFKGGKIATEKEWAPIAEEIFKTKQPIYSMFDENIGEFDKNDVRRFIQRLKDEGYDGAVMTDYSSLNSQDDAETIALFNAAKSTKISEAQAKLSGQRPLKGKP